MFIALSQVYHLDAEKICSEWNFFLYFQTMVQLLGALTGCVQHVCATQESVILENIHSLPSSVLHVIKSTFVHCKVSNGSKYSLNGLESMSKGPEFVVFIMFVHKLTCNLYYCNGFFHRANSMYVNICFKISSYREILQRGLLQFHCCCLSLFPLGKERSDMDSC